MANTLSHTNQGGLLPPNATGNDRDALVECAGRVGADDAARAVVSQALSPLIGSVELRASFTADDDASQQQPPLSLPVLDGSDAVVSTNEIGDEVVCDYKNKNSVNHFYPKQNAKSKQLIPIGPLKLLDTDAEKHSFCMKWEAVPPSMSRTH
ncbi:hypothetical protein ACHAXM_006466 [Skeletonema potamos]